MCLHYFSILYNVISVHCQNVDYCMYILHYMELINVSFMPLYTIRIKRLNFPIQIFSPCNAINQ